MKIEEVKKIMCDASSIDDEEFAGFLVTTGDWGDMRLFVDGECKHLGKGYSDGSHKNDVCFYTVIDGNSGGMPCCETYINIDNIKEIQLVFTKQDSTEEV